MALSDKNILITPNIGQSADPKIEFVGASSTLGPQTITLRVYPTTNGTISLEGSAGQLFSVTNSLTGTIYSVNDVSGIPSIEVLDTGLVKFAQYSGNVLVGTGTDNGNKLRVAGTTHVNQLGIGTANNTNFDFYNNGISYFNGAVTIDDNLSVSSGFNITIGGNTVLHAGNYSSYTLPLSGGTATNVTLGVRVNASSYGGNTSGMSGHSFPAEIRASGAKPTLTWHYENIATRHIALDSDGALNVYNPGESGGAVLKVGGNIVVHEGNYSNYPVIPPYLNAVSFYGNIYNQMNAYSGASTHQINGNSGAHLRINGSGGSITLTNGLSGGAYETEFAVVYVYNTTAITYPSPMLWVGSSSAPTLTNDADYPDIFVFWTVYVPGVGGSRLAGLHVGKATTT
jgi:hypothetical protein